eukprot:3940640-Rhodomonas_salina.3
MCVCTYQLSTARRSASTLSSSAPPPGVLTISAALVPHPMPQYTKQYRNPCLSTAQNSTASPVSVPHNSTTNPERVPHDNAASLVSVLHSQCQYRTTVHMRYAPTPHNNSKTLTITGHRLLRS